MLFPFNYQLSVTYFLQKFEATMTVENLSNGMRYWLHELTYDDVVTLKLNHTDSEDIQDSPR